MEEKIEKIKAIDALEWFWGNICIKKCDYEGIKKLDCYEKMRKIITGFEDYPVTHGQFVYSMQVKNKVCDLADKELKKKQEEDKKQEQLEEQQSEERSKERSKEILAVAQLEEQDRNIEELEDERAVFWPDSEIDDYDKNGAEIGEEWEQAEEYGYDAELIAVNKRYPTEKNEEEEKIFKKLDKKI